MAETVVIVDDDAILCMDLSSLLKTMGYLVVGQAADAQRAISLVRKLQPDLVIMDVKLRGEMDGIAATEILVAERIAPVLLLTGYSNVELVGRAAAAGAAGYLLKPFDEETLRPAIEIALSNFRQIQALQKTVGDLNEERETRELIDSAKDALVQDFHLSEAEALQRIRQASLDSQKSPRAIAEAILLVRKIGT